MGKWEGEGGSSYTPFSVQNRVRNRHVLLQGKEPRKGKNAYLATLFFRFRAFLLLFLSAEKFHANNCPFLQPSANLFSCGRLRAIFSLASLVGGTVISKAERAAAGRTGDDNVKCNSQRLRDIISSFVLFVAFPSSECSLLSPEFFPCMPPQTPPGSGKEKKG